MDAVKNRYAQAAQEREEALCCPVDYDPKYLKIIPAEVIERDYGCGDPSAYVREGDTVLDLGAGGGKICFIAAQVVGPKGRVIGVDMTPDMLALARKHRPTIAERLGYDNIEFRHGQIQDLKLDLDDAESFFSDREIRSVEDMTAYEAFADELRQHRPMIEDNSIDVVVSNCVLNLVRDDLKDTLFKEIYRVLKPGGRIAVSDIVSDDPTPQHMKDDPKLWSGCISGALQTHEFVEKLQEVGFKAVALDKYDTTPWEVVEDIAYRSVTVTGMKPDLAASHAETTVLYTGPWASVTDDHGNTFERARPKAIGVADYDILASGAYGPSLITGQEEETSGGGCC